MFDQPFSPLRFNGFPARKSVQFGSNDKSNVVDISPILEQKRREREEQHVRKPGFFSALVAGVLAYIASKVLMSCLSVLGHVFGGFLGDVSQQAGEHPETPAKPEPETT